MLRLYVFFLGLIAFHGAWGSNVLSEAGQDRLVGYVASEHTGEVEFWKNNTRVGIFDNLLHNEPALFSSLSRTVGGGVAILGDSDGSRNKYHIIAPIQESGEGMLRVWCIYKSVYDAVDGILSAGAVCDSIDLRKFSLPDVISEDGLYRYAEAPDWLSKLKLDQEECQAPSGFVYGEHYVVRCKVGSSDDMASSSTKLFGKSGELIFSIVDFEFIPINGSGNDGFALASAFSDETALFVGSISCLQDDNEKGDHSFLPLTIGNKQSIKYSQRTVGNCLSGQYHYVSRPNVSLKLSGFQSNGISYVMERDGKNDISGLFFLHGDGLRMTGAWVGTDSRTILPVR